MGIKLSILFLAALIVITSMNIKFKDKNDESKN